MNRSILKPTALAAGLALAAASALAQAPVEQRLREEVHGALVRLVESGELDPAQVQSLAVTSPETRHAEFGAIVDVRGDAAQGLPVLAVTPGGSAAALGLRSGDRIIAVQGRALTGLGSQGGRARAGAVLAQALASEDAAPVSLTVMRAGAELELRGPVTRYVLPAYRLELGTALASASLAAASDGSNCGRISVFDNAPRGANLYRAVLISIDGRLPGPTTTTSFPVRPGQHVLTVAEDIDANQFTGVELSQRGRYAHRLHKELVVEVQPGVTYRLAARYDKSHTGSMADKQYWAPVIWRESREHCRM